MALPTRGKVLSIFKTLLRTREKTFNGDEHALQYIREAILGEFRKHKNIQEESKIRELIKVADESDDLLKNGVIQAKAVRPNVFRLNSEHIQSKCVNAKRIRCDNCTCGL